MIFQSLIGLYNRLDLSDDVPPYGFSVESIGFVITIDADGNLIGYPEDLRTKIKSDKYEFRTSVVPYSNKVNARSGVYSNFLVDDYKYVFGAKGKERNHQEFIDLIDKVCVDSNDEGVVAVKAFLKKWDPAGSPNLKDWNEISGTHGKWVAFRLKENRGFVHERPAIKKLWANYAHAQIEEKLKRGTSLTDGKLAYLQAQHAQFPFGSGASFSGCKNNFSWSYGKEKGENAPVSVEAEFKSATALKYLLHSKTQRLYIGDAVTVFWAEKASPAETFMGQALNPFYEDEEAATPIQTFLKAVRAGKMPAEIKPDADVKFYILGFSINKARIALRFWYVSTVAELFNRLHDHFRCLEIERSEKDVPFPGIWHLLRETARETKDISPVLGGALARAILTGGPYPQNLYQSVLGRIRADAAKKDTRTKKPVENVTYLRAAILKSVLVRNHNKEVPMSLDTERHETAYLLGRLFAVMEKAQLDALGKVNATIKDRFFSAASATPASVFPRLLRLSQHHIDKAEYGYVSDKRIGEIMEHVESFPTHMGLQDQGLFAIAYYHQKNALYRKQETTTEGEKND